MAKLRISDPAGMDSDLVSIPEEKKKGAVKRFKSLKPLLEISLLSAFCQSRYPKAMVTHR